MAPDDQLLLASDIVRPALLPAVVAAATRRASGSPSALRGSVRCHRGYVACGGMARDLDGAIAERARTSLGLLTNAHLNELGVSRQQRRTLIANGVLVPVHRGVVRHAAHPVSWLQAVHAATLAAGPGAVASHSTAAALWRFDGTARCLGDVIELSVSDDRNPRALAGVLVHRCSDLVPADLDVHRTVPCTTPSRTLIDIAAITSARRLEATVDDVERRGLVWRPHLRWRLDELGRRGRTGVPQLRALLDATDGRPLGDSWLEQEAIRLVVGAGLPVPRCQVRLRKAGGGIARVDLLWHAARLAVELNGHGTHATRRQRQADAERAARLALAGWRVIAFTYEDVTERPEHVVTMIAAHLAQATDASA